VQKLFGWHEKKGAVERFLPTVSGAEMAGFLQLIKTADRGSTADIKKSRRRKKDGSIMDGNLPVSLVKGLSWQVIERAGILEQARVEKALRESEATAVALLNATHDAAGLVDIDGTILLLNNTLAARLGDTVEKLIGRNVYDLLTPRLAQRARRYIDEAVRSGRPRRIEYKRIGRWNNGHVYPVFDSEGKVRSVALFAQDITDRKRSEATLRESERQFRQLVENSPVAMAALSRTDQKVMMINRKFRELFGYTEADIPRAEQWWNLAYPEEKYREKMRSLWKKSISAADKEHSLPRPMEAVVTCKDGSLRYIEFSYSSLGGMYMVSFVDITDRRKLEAQLLEAQKMKAIGTLAGGIAHDFNNILTGIQGHASLMLMDTDVHHPNYNRLSSIEDQVKSGAGLTRQLLDFARSGQYQIQPTDMNDVIKKTADMFGRTKKEITIHHIYDEGLWLVAVDRGQIEQVLLNLYVNAWQAMPAGGDIFLELRNVVLDDASVKPHSAKAGNYVKISVTDTGIGMDRKTKSRIFEPFFTTKERGRGTGLGLATVYGIIKGHKGFITVYSEQGRGTTFVIYLPVSAGTMIREKTSFEEPLRGSGTVLIVDDEETILEVTRDLIGSLGYQVMTAKNGREAFKIYMAEKDRIDLVILDMIMPEMGGRETLKKLKEANPDVKVILSSGYSMNGQAASLMKEGCRAFVQKPYSLRDLSRKVKEVLDGEIAAG